MSLVFTVVVNPTGARPRRPERVFSSDRRNEGGRRQSIDAGCNPTSKENGECSPAERSIKKRRFVASARPNVR